LKLDPRILPDMGVKVAFLGDRGDSGASAAAAVEKPLTSWADGKPRRSERIPAKTCADAAKSGSRLETHGHINKYRHALTYCRLLADLG
jgi:hypothetical protein